MMTTPADRPTMWEHEKLVVYRKAIAAVVLLDRIGRGLPDGYADLRDQLQRAGNSIPLNLAEGASEFSPAEKARFYRMAKRSAAECASALDIIEATVVPAPSTREAKEALSEVAAWTTRLIHAQPRRR